MDEHGAPTLAAARQCPRQIGRDKRIEAVRYALECEGAAFLELSDGAFKIGHLFLF